MTHCILLNFTDRLEESTAFTFRLQASYILRMDAVLFSRSVITLLPDYTTARSAPL